MQSKRCIFSLIPVLPQGAISFATPSTSLATVISSSSDVLLPEVCALICCRRCNASSSCSLTTSEGRMTERANSIWKTLRRVTIKKDVYEMLFLFDLFFCRRRADILKILTHTSSWREPFLSLAVASLMTFRFSETCEVWRIFIVIDNPHYVAWDIVKAF